MHSVRSAQQAISLQFFNQTTTIAALAVSHVSYSFIITQRRGRPHFSAARCSAYTTELPVSPVSCAFTCPPTPHHFRFVHPPHPIFRRPPHAYSHRPSSHTHTPRPQHNNATIARLRLRLRPRGERRTPPSPTLHIPAPKHRPMRFDRLRRRAPAANPTPVPPSPLPTPFTYERDDFCDSSVSYDSTPGSRSPLPTHPAYSRQDYIRALEARMEQMEKVPTSSFFHSYAGEFDMLLGEDRQANRRMHEFETSTKVENASRNRYANILSNEPTRVKLREIAPGDNDYINANLVSGHDGHPGYIATQAPLPETTQHFWQMVHESHSPVVIMLTREKEDHCDIQKSDQYWPNLGQTILYNDYLVHGIAETIDEEHGVIERTFHVGRVVDKRKKHATDLVHADSLNPPDDTTWPSTPNARATNPICDDDDMNCDDNEELFRNLELIGSLLEVVQLQYIDWPDQHVPATPYSLLDLCKRVNTLLQVHRHKTGRPGPPVVHCSAGVGRTGTFIAIDKTLRRLNDAFTTPTAISRQPVYVEEIRDLVRKLKHERSKMVQTAEQYRFIFKAVYAAMRKWENGDRLFDTREDRNR